MLISVVTTSSQEIKNTGLHFEEVNVYVLLSDNALSASVIMSFDMWFEQNLSGKALDFHLILPLNTSKLEVVKDTNKHSKRSWINASIVNDTSNSSLASVNISAKELIKQKSLTLGLSYDVTLTTKSVDLSLHGLTVVGNMLSHISPQQEPIPINHANIWLIYSNQAMRVFTDKSASENRLSGSDLTSSNHLLSSKVINSKKDYSRLLWHISRPSLSLPFYLNAIIQSGEQLDELTRAEIKVVLDSMGQKTRELENTILQTQQELELIKNQILTIHQKQNEMSDLLQSGSKN